ncbi:MAG TPA: helix-turn-helix domain-containing protein [Candidatus Limnocylindrales bacterium]|nr:helix-turn-helix domain-containing protein [Candidatus Limnocylindrales bacterium]
MVSRVVPGTILSFGSLLRRHRVNAGLSQDALAEQAGIGADEIDALERGAAPAPPSELLGALATALGLTGARREAFESAAAPPEAEQLEPTCEPATPGRGAAGLGTLPSFVGRDAELAEIAAALGASRLVTIIGPGGVGKTRIAQQIAIGALPDHPGGVWVAELAPLSDPELIPVALASALGIGDPTGGTRPLLDTVVSALRAKRALLVLDNCEHLRDGVTAVARTLLAGCPKLRILATSREGLGHPDELLYRLPPLAVSDGPEKLGAAEALRYGAVALFVARAQAAKPDFVLTDELAPAAAEICRSLDGIALAIELAAARLSVLTVEQLAKRLDDRFRVLTGGGNALPRQQTLRALIDWSFDLLRPPERTVFMRLAVFRGGWTAEAAADVCGCPEDDVPAALASLVDKSLVVADRDAPRFRFTATTGQYAAEKLLRSGEYDATAGRLAAWALAFAERAEATWETTPELAWRDAVECELDNLRAALDWSLGRGRDPLTGAAIVAGLGHYWRFAKREGRRWFEAALAATGDDAPAPLAARIMLGLSWTLPVGRSNRDAAERAVRAYRELGDRRSLAMALMTLGGSIREEPGWLERAEAVVDEALAIAQSTCFFRLVPSLLAAAADLRRVRGDLDGARELLEEALKRAREEQNLLGLSTALSRLAEVEFAAENFAAARRYGAEATEVDGRRGVENAVSADRCDLAAYAIADGDLDGACAEARTVIAMSDRVDQPVHLAIAVEHLGVVAALRGDVERAARLLGYSDAMFRRLAYARQPVEQRGEERARAILAERLAEDATIALGAEGEAFSRDEAVTEALAVAP